jgi:AcrR family transcriptional regulator
MASDKRHHHEDLAGSQLRDLVADQVAQKLNEVATKVEQKYNKKLENAERRSQRANRRLEVLEQASARVAELDFWTRSEPGARKPRFTREDIAAAALRIADAEGFEAVSMRRIATELGAGTMTLYHYVKTKDELLALLFDAIMGEVVVPVEEPLPTDWREALTIIATRSRDAFRRHPWVIDVTDEPPLGPNSVRHFDQSLAAVASLPVGLAEKADIINAVDEYVFGYCLSARDEEQPITTQIVDYVSTLIETGEYPELAALAREPGLSAAWRAVDEARNDPTRFERNLQRFLDGIERSLSR